MQAVPDYGESVSEIDERGKYEQTQKHDGGGEVGFVCGGE